MLRVSFIDLRDDKKMGISLTFDVEMNNIACIS